MRFNIKYAQLRVPLKLNKYTHHRRLPFRLVLCIFLYFDNHLVVFSPTRLLLCSGLASPGTRTESERKLMWTWTTYRLAAMPLKGEYKAQIVNLRLFLTLKLHVRSIAVVGAFDIYVCIQNACAQDVDADLRKLTRADVQRVFDDDDDDEDNVDDGAVVGRWQWKEGDSCLQVVLHSVGSTEREER